jgi:hypothetical protein
MPTDPSIEARVGVLESTVATVSRDVGDLKSELNTDVAEIRKDLKELRDLLAGRPTWSVLTVISGLGAVASALGATLLTLLVKVA